MTRIPAAMPSAPKSGRPAANPHAAQPNDSVVSSVTKMRWKALSDMLMGRARGKIVHGVNRQPHQGRGEKHGKAEHGVNHFPLRNQVHEKSGDDKGVAAGDRQDEPHLDRPTEVLL